MKGFSNEAAELKVNELLSENEIQISELTKILNSKQEFESKEFSGVSDRLRQVVKDFQKKTLELELTLATA